MSYELYEVKNGLKYGLQNIAGLSLQLKSQFPLELYKLNRQISGELLTG